MKENLVFNLHLDNINEIYEIQKITLNESSNKIKYPFSFGNNPIIKEYISDKMEQINEINVDDYKKLFFFKTSSTTFMNGFHIVSDWFKKGIELSKENTSISEMIKKDLEKYITDTELINSILDNNFENIKDADYLYIAFYYNEENVLKIKKIDELIKILKTEKKLIDWRDLIPIIKLLIYKNEWYKNINGFNDFIIELEKYNNEHTKEIIEFAKGIQIYTLCKKGNFEYNKVQNAQIENLEIEIEKIFEIINNYYAEFDDQILAYLIEKSEINDPSNDIFNFIHIDVKLKGKTKQAVEKRLKETIAKIAKIDKMLIKDLSKYIEEFAKNQNITFDL